jgi:hypothetical protein
LGASSVRKRGVVKFFVDRKTGCWLWQGVTDNDGYGRFANTAAHRYMYELIIGPIPKGKELDHFECDREGCVNPFHCKPVTHKQNCQRQCSGHVVTKKRAHQIRRDWFREARRPRGSKLVFAKKYNISRQVLYNIIDGVNWN